ncbi:SNARE domain protein [Ceratocystis platani]|uniref:SNARE domain protein n=1 Tax=Ceratocystis fimbriata f. sp. platani TaxID=88771 RepID=A0A0F8B1K9_CERFI|nr:SNARE domain protein [Ceratocystis platani]
MSTTGHLFILADHIKLALLERQRASSALAAGTSLGAEADSQDGHIARSLEQLNEGIAALRTEEDRLRSAGSEDAANDIDDSLITLSKQLDSLTSQFHRFTAPDPLSASSSPSSSPSAPASQGVRFRDLDTTAGDGAADVEAQQLFGTRYTDATDSAGYRDEADDMSNEQIHTFHDRIMDEQDAHLDRLGESISRQRELSMRIGDELDAHVGMLEDTEAVVDRHQSWLDRARRSLNRIAEDESDSRGMMTIVILIIILILLIAILK